MSASGGGLGPGTTYTLKLGSTWDNIPTDLIHAVQYDFKPASVDPSQPGQMRLEGTNGITVVLPHKDTDESSEFKGNKQQTSKDCFLIMDKATNTIYLEKVSNMIRVKKHRSVKKKPAVRKELEEGDRASPIPAALQAKETPATTNRISPIPTRSSPEPSKPPSPLPQPDNSDSEPKVKRPKPSSAIASSGNLSSESSGSDSDSSNDSSDSENEVSFVPVKEEGQLDLANAGALISPLGEPDVNEEDAGSSNAIMNMLTQDLDITSSEGDSD